MESLSNLSIAVSSVLSDTTSMNATAILADPTEALSSVVALASDAVIKANDVVPKHTSASWFTIILWLLHLISSVLYFVLKLATISTPTFLFNIFSTSLTVTMNATTL